MSIKALQTELDTLEAERKAGVLDNAQFALNLFDTAIKIGETTPVRYTTATCARLSIPNYTNIQPVVGGIVTVEAYLRGAGFNPVSNAFNVSKFLNVENEAGRVVARVLFMNDVVVMKPDSVFLPGSWVQEAGRIIEADRISGEEIQAAVLRGRIAVVKRILGKREV